MMEASNIFVLYVLLIMNCVSVIYIIYFATKYQNELIKNRDLTETLTDIKSIADKAISEYEACDIERKNLSTERDSLRIKMMSDTVIINSGKMGMDTSRMQ